MADEPKPSSISYSDVEKSGVDSPLRVWEKIGEITGAGHIPRNAEGHATIDTTELSDSKKQRIANLLANKADEPEEAPARGKK